MIDYETFAKIHDCHDRQGLTIVQTARVLGLHPQTVATWLARSRFEPRRSRPRGSILDPFKPRITRLLETHPYSAQQIFQRLREEGYGGGMTILRDYVRRIRPPKRPVYLKLHFAPGECAQVDWGGAVKRPDRQATLRRTDEGATEPRYDKRTREDAPLIPWRSRDALPTLHAAEPGDVGLVAAGFKCVRQGRGRGADRCHCLVDRAVLDPGLLNERSLDLRPALVALVVERPRHRAAGSPFTQGGKLVDVFRQDLISGADDQLHDGK